MIFVVVVGERRFLGGEKKMGDSVAQSPINGNRSQISGWAEFDRKLRQKQRGVQREVDSEAYPSLSAPIPAQTSLLLNKNKAFVEKPFSSVVTGSTDFPSLISTKDRNLQSPEGVGDSCGQSLEAAVEVDEFHHWMDGNLVPGCRNTDELNYMDNQKSFDNRGLRIWEWAHCSGRGGDAYFGLPLTSVKPLPAEPEFECEYDAGDVYSIHRRDAIRMIRSASRHSKAASDAYLRGDHLSAHHFSVKAQEEWTSAKKLNAIAAKEILATRNSKNDPWTLDLHGLHASEAVLALAQHLQKVESLVSSNFLSTSSAFSRESDAVLSESAPSLDCVKTGKFVMQLQPLRHRPASLQIITGKGNHSREIAALPSAIRNFLNEKGYHFDETRPGVITVRPKFRRQMALSYRE